MSTCVVLWPLIALAGWVFGNLALLGAMAAFDRWHTRRRDRLRQHRLPSSSRASSRVELSPVVFCSRRRVSIPLFASA